MDRSHRKRFRFDPIEVVSVGIFCALVGFAGAAWSFGGVEREPLPGDIELAPLVERFGPSRNSQYFEEWVLRDFFGDKRSGFFLDVGASEYQKFSNTYFLEKELGWSGIAIDALPQFADGYRQHRPLTRFYSFFVSDRSDESATLFVLPSTTEVSSTDKAFTERWGTDVEKVEVRTVTLDDLLTAQQVDKIDFLSMDIELAEPKALAGFTISQYRPALVCIEAHPEVRQAILDYFASNNYTVVGKYLRLDPFNLYFKPRG